MNNKDNIAWRPQTIAKPGVRASFTYGTSEQRVLMEVRDSTLSGQTMDYAATLTRRYYFAGGRYEINEGEQYSAAGQSTPDTSIVTQRLYLMGDPYSAPAVYVATSTETSAGQGNPVTTEAVLFIGRDYQGSITHLINGDGTLAAEYGYDPWGRPRDPQTLTQYTTDNAPALLLGRGYTGHEWLPWFALYNANARLYDPLLGRFLEPDPYVQAPDFTQSYNRYAYCLNNPLKYSDESGELFFTWKLSRSGFRFGINLGFVGFGIAVSWEKDIMLGGYLEEGFRAGGSIMGVGVNLAATTEQMIMWGVNGTRRTTFSVNLEASFYGITASTNLSYEFSGDEISKGKVTASGNLSASLINKKLSIGGGYTYKYDYDTRTATNSISLNASFKNKNTSRYLKLIGYE